LRQETIKGQSLEKEKLETMKIKKGYLVQDVKRKTLIMAAFSFCCTIL